MEKYKKVGESVWIYTTKGKIVKKVVYEWKEKKKKVILHHFYIWKEQVNMEDWENFLEFIKCRNSEQVKFCIDNGFNFKYSDIDFNNIKEWDFLLSKLDLFIIKDINNDSIVIYNSNNSFIIEKDKLNWKFCLIKDMLSYSDNKKLKNIL